MRHGYLNIGAATLFPKIQVRDLRSLLSNYANTKMSKTLSTGVKLRHTSMVISQRTERHTLWSNFEVFV
jgi:hypothetical protein